MSACIEKFRAQWAARLIPVAVILCAFGCAARQPSWVNGSPPEEFPAEKYLLGVGSCPVAGGDEASVREAAYRRACAEIAAQLRNEVAAVWGEKAVSRTKGKKSSSESVFVTQKRLATDLVLEGARILRVYRDSENNRLYVLAGLELPAFSARLKEKVRQALKEREKLLVRLRELEKSRAWGALLKKRAELDELNENVRTDLAVLGAFSAKEADSLLEELSAQGEPPALPFTFELRVVSGGDQRVLPGLPLSEPIEVEALARFADRTEPVAHLGLRVLLSDRNPAEIQPPSPRTGPSGRTSFTIPSVPQISETLTLRIMPEGFAEHGAPFVKVDLQRLTPETAQYGALVLIPQRDRRGRPLLVAWVTEVLDPMFPLQEVFAAPGTSRATPRLLKRFSIADIVFVLDTRVDAIEGSGSSGRTAEARIRPALWSRWANRILWSGPVVQTTNRGPDTLTAARRAATEALRRTGALIRRALPQVLGTYPQQTELNPPR